MKKILIAAAAMVMSVNALAMSLAEASAKITDIIKDPSMMSSVAKELSADDQILFLKRINSAIEGTKRSVDSKTALFWGVKKTYPAFSCPIGATFVQTGRARRLFRARWPVYDDFARAAVGAFDVYAALAPDNAGRVFAPRLPFAALRARLDLAHYHDSTPIIFSTSLFCTLVALSASGEWRAAPEAVQAERPPCLAPGPR